MQKNIFVYGLTGSGKDTISDYVCKLLDYRKIRLAKTIKQIICETNNLTPNELETNKRFDAKLRKMHVTVSDNLEEMNKHVNKHSIIRLHQLISKTHIDFEMLNEIEILKPLMICDARSFDHCNELLKSGAIGIFLKRTSKNTVDNTNKGDWTEKSLFDVNNKGVSDVDKLMIVYPKQVFIIDNNDVTERQLLIDTENFLNFEENLVTPELLLSKVDIILKTITQNEN